MIINWLSSKEFDCKYIDGGDELTLNEIYDSIVIMNQLYDRNKLFHVFYGNEFLTRPHINNFISKINNEDIHYTFSLDTTNKDSILELLSKIKYFKSLIVTLDPLMGCKNSNVKENSLALEILKLNKELKLTDNMIIECIFNKINANYAKQFFQIIQKEHPEATINFSFYDHPKNEWYEPCANNTTEYEDMMKMKSNNPKLQNIFNIAYKKLYNLYLGNSISFLKKLERSSVSEYKCDIIHENNKNNLFNFKTLTIDRKGIFRLCLRIGGIVGINIRSIFNAELDDRCKKICLLKLWARLRYEYNVICKGCSWTYPIIDEELCNTNNILFKKES